MVCLVPLLILFIGCFGFYRYFVKRRERQLQRVYVAPQGGALKAGSVKLRWDMHQAGKLSSQELQKVWKAVKDAEKDDLKLGPQSRHLAFGVKNALGAEHLRMLRALLDSHPRVTISLDTDWRWADDQCLKALAVIAKRKERCTFSPPIPTPGLNTLKLSPDANSQTIEGLADVLTNSGHYEVDALSFVPPGAIHSVRGEAVVGLTPIRLSCQELLLRRCPMGDLGTVAVCAFVRPWCNRIQTMKLTECEIGDAGAAALSRILGPGLRELCLTSNEIGDQGITEIGKALQQCDSLERLLLDRNFIGNEGAKALGSHILRSNVSELTLGSHLGGNPIREEGVMALARALDDELPRAAANRATRLGALNLDNCIVGEEGANALADHLPRSSLMFLSLARGRIDDYGCAAITKALPRTIQSIDLSGNDLTDRSAQEVAEALCTIPHLAVSLANNHLSIGLRQILHEEHGQRLRL